MPEFLTLPPSVFWISKSVGYMNRCGLQRRSRYQRASTRRDRILLHVVLILRREAVVCSETVDLGITQKDLYIFCLT